MILSVNGMAVAVEADAPAEFAAAHELLARGDAGRRAA